MLKKIASISAPINKFVRNGKEETFYKPVGSLMENPDTGKQFLLLDKSINLMAVIGASDETKGSVFLPLEFIEQNPSKQHSKPFTDKATHSVIDKTKQQNSAGLADRKPRRQRPTPQAIRNAKELLNTDLMMRQNVDKDGKHIDLPFDDEL